MKVFAKRKNQDIGIFHAIVWKLCVIRGLLMLIGGMDKDFTKKGEEFSPSFLIKVYANNSLIEGGF